MSTFVWAVLIAIYFLPAVIANCKRKKNSGAILVLNIFLGWTVIRWIAALVWSATKD